jgi:hypothetical protein
VGLPRRGAAAPKRSFMFLVAFWRIAGVQAITGTGRTLAPAARWGSKQVCGKRRTKHAFK